MTPFEAFLSCKRVSTDTRNILPNSIFFALKGARFNGNEYAMEALNEGALYAVVDEVVGDDPRLIHVDDVLSSLQECARSYRRTMNIPVVGLTGSNGKTTNKELFQAVLKQRYRVHATAGNLNNHIGVPLTLLAMPDETEIVIIEMGANHQKEIALLSAIAEPTIGYITNYGKAHLEGFGGVQGIIKGKSELYDHCRENSTTVMINYDDPIQVEKSTGIASFGYGRLEGLLWESSTESEFAAITFTHNNRAYEVKSKLSGRFNEQNIVAAVCLGLHFSVHPEEIIQAIEEYTPEMNRVEWRATAQNKVLLDAYNANPTSMSLSVESFAKWHPEGWMILGDMFELGASAQEEHAAIIALVQSVGMENRTVLVGKHFGSCDWEGLQFETTAELQSFWNKKGAPKGAHILLKGSRGIALERLLSSL